MTDLQHVRESGPEGAEAELGSAGTDAADPGHDGVAPDAPKRIRRRWRRSLTPLTRVLVLVVVAGSLWFFLLRDQGAGEVGVEDVLAGFDPADVEALDVAFLPPQGVYSYYAVGFEELQGMGVSHDQGPDVAGVLVWEADGCWTLKFHLNDAHWSENRFCNADDGSLSVTDTWEWNYWKIMGVGQENTANTGCPDPAPLIKPGMQPGDSWAGGDICTGRNSSSQVPGRMQREDTITFVGVETVDVGGVPVPAYHIHEDKRISPLTPDNTNEGTQSIDWWLSQETGMPLRHVREVIMDTESLVGDIHYRENGDYQLLSLEPQTG